MAHLRTTFTPFGIYIAIGKFNKIQCILHIRIQLIKWHQFGRIELAGHATIQNRQWCCTDIFCQLKIFKEAQPKCLKIIRCRAMCKFKIPAVDDQLPFFNRTDCFFPLITLRKIISFYNTSTGKPIKPGFISANICIISARIPPGLFFQVSSGNKEIISRSITPFPSNHIFNLPFSSVPLN